MEEGGRPHRGHRYRETLAESRAVGDPGHAWTHLAREPGEPVVACRGWRGGPRREVQGHTPMMYDHGQSDSPVVPAKFPNKAGRPAAEGMEGRGLAKGNPSQHTAPRAQDRVGALSALERVRASCGAGQAGAVHDAPAPRLHIDHLRPGLPRAEAGGGAGDRRRDVAALRGGLGGEPRGTSRDGWREGRIERSRSSGRTSPRPTGGNGRWASPRWKTSSSSARRSRC